MVAGPVLGRSGPSLERYTNKPESTGNLAGVIYAQEIQAVLRLDLPHLEEQIDRALFERHNDLWATERAPDGILRSSGICGAVSDIIGSHLRQCGFPVSFVKIPDLDRYGVYPFEDHYFLVTGRGERETVVDAAFYQYMRVLGVAREFMPNFDVFVAPYSALREELGRLALIRTLNPNDTLTVFQRNGELQKTPVPVPMSVADLTQYFLNIWDYKRNSHIVAEESFFSPRPEKASKQASL